MDPGSIPGKKKNLGARLDSLMSEFGMRQFDVHMWTWIFAHADFLCIIPCVWSLAINTFLSHWACAFMIWQLQHHSEWVMLSSYYWTIDSCKSFRSHKRPDLVPQIECSYPSKHFSHSYSHSDVRQKVTLIVMKKQAYYSGISVFYLACSDSNDHISQATPSCSHKIAHFLKFKW